MKNKNNRQKQLPPTNREIRQRFEKLLNARSVSPAPVAPAKKKKFPVNQLWDWNTLEDVTF